MSKEVKHRRGTTAEHAAFTGALAEITVDTTTQALHVHDSVSIGGFVITTDRKRATHTVDSVASAITWATDNATTLQSIRTTSYRDEAACLALSIPYPDGGGADYVVKPSTYVPLGGDHVAGTVVLALTSTATLNIKQFGAVGDGIVDDLSAIQSAIDSVQSLAGAYVIEGDGIFGTSNTLITKSSDLTIQNLSLKALPTWPVQSVDLDNMNTADAGGRANRGDPMIRVWKDDLTIVQPNEFDNGRVKIQNCHLDGSLLAPGISLENMAQCSVTQTTGTGIRWYGITSNVKNNVLKIKGCSFNEYLWGQDGHLDPLLRTARIFNLETADFMLEGCVANYGVWPLYCKNVFNAQINDLHVFNGDADNNGIAIYGGAGLVITNLYLDGVVIDSDITAFTIDNVRWVWVESGFIAMCKIHATSVNQTLDSLIITNVNAYQNGQRVLELVEEGGFNFATIARSFVPKPLKTTSLPSKAHYLHGKTERWTIDRDADLISNGSGLWYFEIDLSDWRIASNNNFDPVWRFSTYRNTTSTFPTTVVPNINTYIDYATGIIRVYIDVFEAFTLVVEMDEC